MVTQVTPEIRDDFIELGATSDLEQKQSHRTDHNKDKSSHPYLIHFFCFFGQNVINDRISYLEI